MAVSPRLLKASLSVLSLGLSLVAAECALRFVARPASAMLMERGAELHEKYFVPDPMLSLRRRPDVDFYFDFEERPSGSVHFVTNNQGLRRTGDTAFEKPAKVKRIVTLGDSHLDGVVDNEENVSFLLESRLNHERSAGSGRWEVLNAAVGSYSPYQNYLWYRATGKRFEPDVVLFGFYLGNDLVELATEDRPRLGKQDGRFLELKPSTSSGGTSVNRSRESRLEQFDHLLTGDSYLYGHLKDFHDGLTHRLRTGLERETRPADYIGCVAQSLGQISWTKNRRDYECNLQVFEEVLRRMASEVQSGGGRLLLVLVPTRLQIEPELDQDRISQTAATFGLSKSDLEFENRLAQDLRDIAKAQSVPVLDLAPSFRASHESRKQPLYYQLDWHMNALAHEVAAETIYATLTQSGIR